MRGNIALCRQPLNGGTAGITEVQHARNLVEGFAGGVVAGTAKKRVGDKIVYPVEFGVAAGDAEGNVRENDLLLKENRQQVAFEVIDADKRNSSSKELMRPGPRVTATRSRSLALTPASLSARSITSPIFSTWTRPASSGTTPP